jgi:regulator of RNase E activity RraA
VDNPEPITSTEARTRFATLTTAHLTDGCIRANVPVRCVRLVSVTAGDHLAGRVLPARHVGSVDVFLEAFETAADGDILVVDNAGRLDESCVGDLLVLEAKTAGMGGIVIWGLNRDSVDIRAIGLPVFSLGTIPTGPLQLGTRGPNALASATVGDWTVDASDFVFGDEDGVVFVSEDRLTDVLAASEQIRDTEHRQAALITAGTSLRDQVHFADYLTARETNPALTFREHLAAVGGAIEV